MAQSNVSKLLISIEKEIGLEIFNRSGNKLSLTQFGYEMISCLREFIEKNEEIHNLISMYRTEKKGEVVIYAPAGMVSSLINKFIPTLHDVDDISLTFKTISLQGKWFNECVYFPPDCDILLSLSPPKNTTLVALPVIPLSFNVFASKKYLKENPLVSPNELDKHNCILLTKDSESSEVLWPLNNDGLNYHKVSGSYSCDSFSTACTLAKAGKGLVYAPWEVLVDDILNGSLIPCFSFDMSYKRHALIIFKKRTLLPYHVQFILDRLKEYCVSTVEAQQSNLSLVTKRKV